MQIFSIASMKYLILLCLRQANILIYVPEKQQIIYIVINKIASYHN